MGCAYSLYSVTKYIFPSETLAMIIKLFTYLLMGNSEIVPFRRLYAISQTVESEVC